MEVGPHLRTREYLMDIAQFLVTAFMTVGFIQWLKNLLPPTAPKWIFVVALPVAAIGIGAIPVGSWLWIGVGTFAAGQLGYELIIQTVKQKFGAVK